MKGRLRKHYKCNQSPFDAPYERPNQTWVCGMERDGAPCPLGPDSKGTCNTKAECVPGKSESAPDRWICKHRGEKCAEGPRPDGSCAHPLPPCQPVRSLRARRGRVVTSVAALTFGLLLWLSASSWRDAVISPGALSSAHANLSDSCERCHSAAQDGWIHSAMNGTSPAGLSDSRRCLECHRRTGDHPMNAHGLSDAHLADLTKSASESSAAGSVPFLLSFVGRGKGEIACAECHREHRGSNSNLAAMEDLRCQACHVRKFESFSNGHPEFVDYPYRRRTRIRFDHRAHDTYFRVVPNPAEFQCARCHVMDDRSRNMALTGFEMACKQCHSNDFEPRDVLWFPEVDVKTLRDKQVDIGGWPDGSRFDVGSERLVMPLLAMLLGTEKGSPPDGIRQILELPDHAYSHLEDADEAELKKAREFAWAFKRLMVDLRQGSPDLESTWNLAIGTSLKDDPLLAGWLQSGVLALTRDWGSRLEDDVRNHLEGKPVSTEPLPGTVKGNPQGPSLDGWSHSGSSVASHRSSHASPHLQRLIDLVLERTDEKVFRDLALEPGGLLDWITGPSGCVKCHSVDESGDGSLRINWRGKHRDDVEGLPTRFAHGPHVDVPRWNSADCRRCHEENSRSEPNARFYGAKHTPNLEVRALCSDYRPLSKAQCSTCHVGGRSGTSCQTCHRYHVSRLDHKLKDLHAYLLK